MSPVAARGIRPERISYRPRLDLHVRDEQRVLSNIRALLIKRFQLKEGTQKLIENSSIWPALGEHFKVKLKFQVKVKLKNPSHLSTGLN